jgi:hypothetical protein
VGRRSQENIFYTTQTRKNGILHFTITGQDVVPEMVVGKEKSTR